MYKNLEDFDSDLKDVQDFKLIIIQDEGYQTAFQPSIANTARNGCSGGFFDIFF